MNGRKLESFLPRPIFVSILQYLALKSRLLALLVNNRPARKKLVRDEQSSLLGSTMVIEKIRFVGFAYKYFTVVNNSAVK